MNSTDRFADAAFEVEGETVPIDHGYALFSAISKLIPELHSETPWGLHTIPGRASDSGLLQLDGRSVLRIRLPASQVAKLFPLVGASLAIDSHAIRLGGLTLHPLVPSASLWAKLVTLKGHTQPESFLDCMRRQLADIPNLAQDPERIELLVAHRRVMRIHHKKVVGFRVEVHGLEATSSIRLQECGLGGRRHMGAGLFIPQTRRSL